MKRENKEEEREALVEYKWLKESYILAKGPCLPAKRALYSFKRTLCKCEVRNKEEEHETRGGGLGSSTIFKKFNEPYAPS